MSQLIIALDTSATPEAIDWIDATREYCQMYKIGWKYFYSQGIRGVIQLAARYPDLPFMFDVKLWDTPHTIVDTVEMLVTTPAIAMYTVHKSSVAAAASVQQRRSINFRKRILGISRLTSEESPFNPQEIIDLQAAGARGVVCAGPHSEMVRWALKTQETLIVCPGLRETPLPQDDHQQVVLLRNAHQYKSVDYWVVGRPIIKSADPNAAARRFKHQLAMSI